jgi:hypothetical protein
MKTKFLLLFIIFGFLSAEAQVSLPYLTGFDNTSEQSGWVEYKKGSTQYSHWGFNTISAFSAPKCLSHDYSPSTGITITDNWYVSPGFNIPTGGKLDSLRYMFNGFSVPDNTDTIAVYLLTGSQNPSLASHITLLFDFRNTDYSNDYSYHLLTPIDLIGSNDIQYIAIRYRNTDCSSKWLSVNFDNLSISSNSQNGFESPSLLPNFQIYPNPIKDFLNIKSDKPMEYIRIINLLGKEVLHSEHNLQSDITAIDLTSFPNGVYFIQISCNHQLFTKKIIIQSL